MASSKCYSVGNNIATATNQYFACGNSSTKGGQSCCQAGDYCMENSICHYTHDVVNGTGYYMSGCTDPTWQDPACPKQCTSQFGEDVIYDTTNKRWLCCTVTAGSRDCRNLPNLPPIEAPSPEKLSLIKQINTPIPTTTSTSVVGSISVTITPSTTQSTASTTRSASSTTPTTKPSQSAAPAPDSLPAGVKAGIGIGVTLAAMILAALAFYLLWSKRKHSRRQLKHQQLYGGSSSEFQAMPQQSRAMAPRSTTPLGELDSIDPSSYYTQHAKHDAYAHHAPELVAPDRSQRTAVLGAAVLGAAVLGAAVLELPSDMGSLDGRGRYGRFSTGPRELDAGSERAINELEGSRQVIHEKPADVRWI